jgi:hypothetical protein
MANKDHTHIGEKFEHKVMTWLNKNNEKIYLRNDKVCEFNIGKPPSKRKFDIVSKDRSEVYECKCFTWTSSGGAPHGKMKSISEAVLRLSFISGAETYIVLKRDLRPKNAEPLADYYLRRFGHMLRDTKILEFDDEVMSMRELVK